MPEEIVLDKSADKSAITADQQRKCHAIIHSSSAAAAAIGFGLAQLPGSDMIPLMALQATMVVSLGAVFGLTIRKSSGKAVVSCIGAGQIGRITARSLTNVFTAWIPGVGNAVNAATAGGFTEAIGWATANSFAKGNYTEDEDAAAILGHILKK